MFSKNSVIIPTASTRRRGMFWNRYANNCGEWVTRARYNPRHVPVPVQQFEYCQNVATGEVVLFLLRLERYDG